MSLAAAIEYQSSKPPILSMCSCEGVPALKLKPHQLTLIGITVFDLPMYVCSQCGEVVHPGSVAMAVEDLQSEHNLHGGYYLKQLLDIEKENKGVQH